VDQAVYLRRHAGNRKNLRLVAEYYAARGIPFDPARGFDPHAAASANTPWAQVNQIVPLDWPQLMAKGAAQNPEARFSALSERALVFTLLGSYEAALALDRQALSLRPEALAPRRRRVFSLLRLGRADRALEAARALLRAAPDDPRHRALEAAAARLSAQGAGGPAAIERIRILVGLPLLDVGELQRSLAGRYNPLLLRARK
jgi:tetratricopeptide (TPR) repeat protein